MNVSFDCSLSSWQGVSQALMAILCKRKIYTMTDMHWMPITKRLYIFVMITKRCISLQPAESLCFMKWNHASAVVFILAKAVTKDNILFWICNGTNRIQITLQNVNFQWHDFEFLIMYFDRLKTTTWNTDTWNTDLW